MKAKIFLFPILPGVLVWGLASAQTNSSLIPPAPKPHVVDVPQPEQPSPMAMAASGATGSGDNVDPAKIAEYQKRFKDGYALEQQGKLIEARAVYDGILAEEPKAKGSLLGAGRISLELGELPKADDYLEKLHALVPDFPEAIELLIQINQTLKRDVRVELLLRDFRQLYDSGKVSHPYFVRELIPSEQQDIVIKQFFDYTQDPYTVFMADVRDANGVLKRRILLNYDPDTTRALRAKDPKYATTQVFVWLEPVMKDGRATELNAYLQIFALPDYQKFRSAMLVILANPPKPIYSAPITAQ